MCINNGNADLISLIPMLLEQTQDECAECRNPCEDDEENESWQYFDGSKYCYSCWEELELEKQL